MDYNSIIVRYGEISLKGKNRRRFEHKLLSDLENFMVKRGTTYRKVTLKRGRLYIRGIEELPPLEKVFGVHSYSPALEIEKDYEQLKQQIPGYIEAVRQAESFRVTCQRIDKAFPHTSLEIERELGDILFKATRTPVNLKAPALHVQVEIGESRIYLFLDKIMGFSGMPYGSAGKLVALVSSGIDSPVATFLMMKRGVEPILLHFKITEEEAVKVRKLKQILEEYTAGREIKLIEVSRDALFAGKFKQIYEHQYFHSYICVMCKYLMHRKAGEIARAENALGILTGDNLAQVASQTLKNMYAYHTVSGLPVYSPLISYEKQDTIKIARQIGTYDISVTKSVGCIPPKNPRTGVNFEKFSKILEQALFRSSPDVD